MSDLLELKHNCPVCLELNTLSVTKMLRGEIIECRIPGCCGAFTQDFLDRDELLIQLIENVVEKDKIIMKHHDDIRELESRLDQLQFQFDNLESDVSNLEMQLNE